MSPKKVGMEDYEDDFQEEDCSEEVAGLESLSLDIQVKDNAANGN